MSAQEAAVAAKKKEELQQKQITYAGIGVGALGTIGLIFRFLSAANSRRKTDANRHKRKRPVDEDAPLDWEPPKE
jgi:hypothetical protein